jgi:hypothetical protein
VGSIPNVVIRFRKNYCTCSIGLVSTQSLTKMIAGNFPEGKVRLTGEYGWLPHRHATVSRKCGSMEVSQFHRSPSPVTGIVLGPLHVMDSR